MLELACSLVFFGRCDEHGRDSSPHAARAQSAWDYPQGSRLFAHATDTDDAMTPPTAVSDCLGARAAKNRWQLKLGKGA